MKREILPLIIVFVVGTLLGWLIGVSGPRIGQEKMPPEPHPQWITLHVVGDYCDTNSSGVVLIPGYMLWDAVITEFETECFISSSQRGKVRITGGVKTVTAWEILLCNGRCYEVWEDPRLRLRDD